MSRLDPDTSDAFTAILEREGDGYVALCPELDVASQGGTVEEAVKNLRESVELFLECASAEEIKERLHVRLSAKVVWQGVCLSSEQRIFD